MIPTEVEVDDVSVKGSSEHRDLKAKAGGALAVGKELLTEDCHALLFRCVGHDVPEGGRCSSLGTRQVMRSESMSSLHLTEGVVLEIVSAWRASWTSEDLRMAVAIERRASLVPSVKPWTWGAGKVGERGC